MANYMKKIIAVFFPLVLLVLNFSCQAAPQPQAVNEDDSMVLGIEPGEHWLGKMKVFIFSIKTTPQFAAWIEDENGNFVSNIAVTTKSAKENWKNAPKEGRPESLPVWTFKQKNNQGIGELDAVSMATPKDSMEAKIDENSLVIGNTYNIFLEINRSFDYNERWTEENSGVNGQPSLVYKAGFTAGTGKNARLNPIGHGSADGSDGSITEELGDLTTALTMMKSAYFVLKIR